MTTILVTKDDTGKLTGFGDKDRKEYARLKRTLDELQPGELFTISTWFPREGWRHRKHFKMLSHVFDAQEQFAEPDQLRLWLQVGAGWCEYVPGPTGRMVAIPRSIAYDKLDDAEFDAHHESVKLFLRSDRAMGFLWPHLTPMQASEIVEGIVRPFEEPQ